MPNNSSKKPVFCCSYPKSGRTWLRFILANYFNYLYKFEGKIDYNNVFTLLPNGGNNQLRGMPAYQYMADNRIPLVPFVHLEYHPNFDNFDIVFLIRNVHDTLVSNYFQATNRLGVFSGDIKSYIRDTDIGLTNLIQYLNCWSYNLTKINHTVISYENMHNNTKKSVADIIHFLGVNYDDNALSKAIEASNFKNMKSIEIQHGFPNPNLKFNAGDNNALRAREGKIGNHTRYLDANDLQYIDETIKNNLSNMAKELLGKTATE